MTAHAPGPWELGEDDRRDGIDFIQVFAPGLIVAEIYAAEVAVDRFVLTDEVRANARLIASAPELLEALKALAAVAEATTFSDQYPLECEMARSAISKASPSLDGGRDD